MKLPRLPAQTNRRARFTDLTNPIQKLRAFAGLTQGELAKALEVRQSAVSQWETGVRSPWPDYRQKIIALAAAHGVRLTEQDIINWTPRGKHEN